ncbi:MAG: GGDEF domain-containing protein [bacterium]|nr:GGDEF domain-containing protein [bacterium]
MREVLDSLNLFLPAAVLFSYGNILVLFFIFGYILYILYTNDLKVLPAVLLTLVIFLEAIFRKLKYSISINTLKRKERDFNKYIENMKDSLKSSSDIEKKRILTYAFTKSVALNSDIFSVIDSLNRILNELAGVRIKTIWVKDVSYTRLYGEPMKVPEFKKRKINGSFEHFIESKNSAILIEGLDVDVNELIFYITQFDFAVRRYIVRRKLMDLAKIDGLTQVYKRGYFEELLEREVAKANAFGRRIFIALVDIDDFKKLNDTYGHGFGDVVLKRVGLILSSSVYETDIIGRLGGEEFGILFRFGEKEGVLKKLEKVLERIRSEPFEVQGELIYITASIGFVESKIGETANILLEKADTAMYMAKKSGKDRVVCL